GRLVAPAAIALHQGEQVLEGGAQLAVQDVISGEGEGVLHAAGRRGRDPRAHLLLGAGGDRLAAELGRGRDRLGQLPLRRRGGHRGGVGGGAVEVALAQRHLRQDGVRLRGGRRGQTGGQRGQRRVPRAVEIARLQARGRHLDL